uniref:Uncharacterized protein n=1 Tax=Arundo donax TaxID=35708 RepID=A0A0A8XX53_ARUDO
MVNSLYTGDICLCLDLSSVFSSK